MKTFSQLRESKKKMPPGEHVWDKKINRVPVMIHKHKGMFVVYIDGDRLDEYKSKAEAVKAATAMVKVLKK